MNGFIKLSLAMVLAAGLAFGCSSPEPERPVKIATAGIIDATSENQGGQLPLDTVVSASKTHGGSMITKGQPVSQTHGNIAATRDPASPVTVILGPVNAERVEKDTDVNVDAGQSIREQISQVLVSGGSLTLFDAPEERFINDSPRPDLARKGVALVIKGVASSSTDTKEVTVFLRAVDTMTGKVKAVASARDQSQNNAAVRAARQLLEKIIGAK